MKGNLWGQNADYVVYLFRISRVTRVLPLDIFEWGKHICLKKKRKQHLVTGLLVTAVEALRQITQF